MNQYRLPAFAALSSLPSICIASGPGQAELLGLLFFGSIAFSAATHLLSLGIFLPLLRRGALQRTSYAYLIPILGMTSLYIIFAVAVGISAAWLAHLAALTGLLIPAGVYVFLLALFGSKGGT
ncbi:hypothetical protein [Thermomonas carbonis]|uniref:Uncharacterized protein n=1 Tax=Thermomonas carbonis TaxID=1463158 RepID=A0A7G9SNL9_9GAMM|nr:hypothetical protein [Thermomonas carbonis]QNN69444.1 hypothetical protein H9L16_12265 [Thermomonas carbonis]